MAAIVDIIIKGQYLAGQAFSALNKELGASLDKVRNFTEGFNNIQAGFQMLGQAAGYVVAAFEQTVGATLAYSDQVRDLSRSIGASAVETSKLIQAADDVGLSYGELSNALETAIRKGVEPNIKGIGQLADQYNRIQDPIARTKFLMDNFGKSGADLGRLMRLGSDGIREAGAAAEEAGLIMDEQALASARRLEIAMDDLNDQWEAMKLDVGLKAVPALNILIESMNNSNTIVEKGGLAWVNYIPPLGMVVRLLTGVPAVFDAITNSANENADAIVDAGNKINAYLSSSSTAVNVMPHSNVPIGGYQSGQGPAYPWSETNPTGYRATGGTVVGGVTYWVGENGPEPFTPSGSGTIGGRSMAGGAGGANVTMINQFYGTPQENADAVERKVREMKRNGQI